MPQAVTVSCTSLLHVPIAQMLVEDGKADINLATDSGETALTLSASQGLQRIAEYLLSRPECDLNARGCDGKLADEVAMTAEHAEVARAIRQARARRGQAAAHQAAKG